LIGISIKEMEKQKARFFPSNNFYNQLWPSSTPLLVA
jgi:hypothetical protein